MDHVHLRGSDLPQVDGFSLHRDDREANRHMAIELA
jgi:hypothetical protein